MAASDSFAYSVDDQERLIGTHASNEFLPNDVELFIVKQEDEREDDRLVHGFGDVCPLALAPGVGSCKSFKEKLWGCRSVVCEELAKNHLARHAFTSTNHETYNDLAASFEAANDAGLVTEVETRADRDMYRRGNRIVEKDDKWRSRSRERARSRSPADWPWTPELPSTSSSSGASSKAPHPQPRSAPAAKVGVAENLGAIVPSAMHKKHVKVSVAELKTLEACLGRVADTQQRAVESLTFFARQIEDERKVVKEARGVICDLIHRIG